MSSVISFRIDRRIKERMEKLKHVNWSEVVRQAIIETIEREEKRLTRKDYRIIRKAAAKSEALSRRAEGWSSTGEIRRWREKRR